MSRGPGKVQRAIREWLEEFPGLVHDIGELACHAYPIDGGKVEKKHRVAIIRALENMPLGDWIITYAREDHNELTIWNRADARSRAWMRCDKSERDAGEGTIHVANMIRAIRATNAYLAETGRSPFNMNATVEAAQSCQAARARMPPPDVFTGHYTGLDELAIVLELEELKAGHADALPAAERDRGELAELAAAMEKARLKKAEEAKAAELARAIEIVTAAGWACPTMGHNGGPGLEN